VSAALFLQSGWDELDLIAGLIQLVGLMVVLGICISHGRRGDPHSRVWVGVTAVLLYFILQLSLSWPVLALLANVLPREELFMPGGGESPLPRAPVTFTVMVLSQIMTLLFVYHMRKGDERVSDPVSVKPAVAWTVIGIVCLFAVEVLWSLIYTAMYGEPELQDVALMVKPERNPAYQVMNFLMVAVTVPITEEILFRSTLQGELRRHGTTVGALVLSSLVFALCHGGPQFLIPIFLMGVILGWVYEKTGRVGCSIGVHMALNGVTMIVLMNS
jgi:membrane protease YdiL (CAAX protease family)